VNRQLMIALMVILCRSLGPEPGSSSFDEGNEIQRVPLERFMEADLYAGERELMKSQEAGCNFGGLTWMVRRVADLDMQSIRSTFSLSSASSPATSNEPTSVSSVESKRVSIGAYDSYGAAYRIPNSSSADATFSPSDPTTFPNYSARGRNHSINSRAGVLPPLAVPASRPPTYNQYPNPQSAGTDHSNSPFTVSPGSVSSASPVLYTAQRQRAYSIAGTALNSVNRAPPPVSISTASGLQSNPGKKELSSNSFAMNGKPTSRTCVLFLHGFVL
jgi:hypothetical protein